MPPPARVCKACKACKVACVDFAPGVACRRCRRLGLVCEPAAKRPKEMTMPVAGQFLPNPRATTPSGAADASALVHRMASLNTSTGAGHIWRAIGAANEPSVAEFTLRHFVKIARRRNAYGLMERVVRACQESDVSLEAVLHCDKRQPDVATHPHELLCVLSESPGYCLLRTIRPNGDSNFFANPAFESNVLSIDEYRRAYDRNEGETMAKYLHPADHILFYETLSPLFRDAACANGTLESATGPEVRVRNRHLDAFVTCSLRLTLLIRREEDFASMAIELMPRGPVPVGLLPHCALALESSAASSALAAGASPTPCELGHDSEAVAMASTELGHDSEAESGSAEIAKCGTETNVNANIRPFELTFELDGGASSGTSLSTGTETNANANIGPFELDDALDFLASDVSSMSAYL